MMEMYEGKLFYKCFKRVYSTEMETKLNSYNKIMAINIHAITVLA